MKYTTALLGLVAQAAAFPFVANDVVAKRQTVGIPSTDAGKAISAARDNCGPTRCLTFDAKEQYVSTTGEHAYRSPAADEIRGPCPGLSAYPPICKDIVSLETLLTIS